MCVKDGLAAVVALQVMSYDTESKVCQQHNTLVAQVKPSANQELLFLSLSQNTQLAFTPQPLLVPSGLPKAQ